MSFRRILLITLIFSTFFLISCDRFTLPQATSQTNPEKNYDINYLTTLLNAELAVDSNNYDLASQNLLSLAEVFQDPMLAKRATKYAIKSGNLTITAQAVTLWARLEPKRIFPQFLAVLLHLNENPEADVQLYLKNIFSIKHQEPRHSVLIIVNQLISKKTKVGLLNNLRHLSMELTSNPQIYFSMAMVNVELGDPQLALSAINKALNIRPDWSSAIGLKAQILILQNKTEEATNFVATQLKKNPQQKDLQIIYGFLLMQTGEYQKAKIHYQQLLDDPKQKGKALIKLGEIAIKEKQIKIAKLYFVQALSFKQQMNEARYLLGRVAESQKQFKQAKIWYLQVRRGQFLVSAHIKAAMLFARDGEVNNALYLLKQINPGTPLQVKLITLAKAQILYDAKRLTAAMSALDTGINFIPNDTDLLYTRSMVASKLGDHQIMEQDLQLILRLQPNNTLALNALGFALADKTKRLQEALGYITRALKIKPHDPMILDSMGWVQYRLGNIQGSLQYLRKAQILSDDDEIAAHLGEVLWMSGQQQKAKSIWEKALKLHPESELLLETMERFIRKKH